MILPTASWPFLPPPVRHDLMMFQISEVSLVPQADNPLPRMVLDLDLFNRAVRRGKLAVPGLSRSFKDPMQLPKTLVFTAVSILK